MNRQWWREHYERKAKGLREVARSYREVAGQLQNDTDFALFALSRAIQNEQWAREDDQRAAQFAP